MPTKSSTKTEPKPEAEAKPDPEPTAAPADGKAQVVVQFREPPPSGRGRGRNGGRWVQVADQLKANPGVWALIDTTKSSGTATSFRRWAADHYGGKWEATSRKVLDDQFDAYVRFVGDAKNA